MKFLTLHLIHIGLLITFSVIGRGDGSPRSLDSLDKTGIDKYEVETQDAQIMCGLCKKAVKKLMTLVIKKFDKEIKLLCSKMHSRNICKQQAYKYETLIIHRIFNGKNAKESCMHMHLC